MKHLWHYSFIYSLDRRLQTGDWIPLLAHPLLAYVCFYLTLLMLCRTPACFWWRVNMYHMTLWIVVTSHDLAPREFGFYVFVPPGWQIWLLGHALVWISCFNVNSRVSHWQLLKANVAAWVSQSMTTLHDETDMSSSAGEILPCCQPLSPGSLQEVLPFISNRTTAVLIYGWRLQNTAQLPFPFKITVCPTWAHLL